MKCFQSNHQQDFLYAPCRIKKNKRCPVLCSLQALWVWGAVPQVGLVTPPEGHSAPPVCGRRPFAEMSWPGTLAPSLEPDLGGPAHGELSAPANFGKVLQWLFMKSWVGAKVEKPGGRQTWHLKHKRVPNCHESASIANVMFAIHLRDIFFYHIKKNFFVLYKVVPFLKSEMNVQFYQMPLQHVSKRFFAFL